MGFLEKINRGYSLNKRLVSPYELMHGLGGDGLDKRKEGREGKVTKNARCIVHF